MIVRLWRGDIDLRKTFWLFGVGGGLLLGLPLFAAMMALTDVPDDATATVFVSALGLLLIYVIWVFVGIWRASDKYLGSRSWAVLAKVVVAADSLIIIAFVGMVLFADAR